MAQPPFPNPTSALSRLSYTPTSSADTRRALAYPRPFLRQTPHPFIGGLFTGLEQDEPRTWMAFGWI